MTSPEVSELLDLAEQCETESRAMFPLYMRDGHTYHRIAFLLDKCAAALRARSESKS